MDEDAGGWGSDFEDDNMGNDDDDDTSWKVRRAAARTIEAVIASRPELLRLIYDHHAAELIGRFKERDDNVKCNVLEAFQQLLRVTNSQGSSSVFESEDSDLPVPTLNRTVSVQSTLEHLASLVPLIVDSLIRQLKSKNVKVRVAVMHTLSHLASVAGATLDHHFAKILPELEKAMSETQGYDLILDTLSILKKLFRGSKNCLSYQQNYQRIQAIIIQALNHDYSKVVAEGLRVVG